MRSRPSHPQTTAGAPPITPTLAWFDPSNLSTIAQSGGLVSQLDDLSGNGHHLTATGGARPTTGTATIGGLNALSFTAGNTLVCAGVVQPQPLTIFTVIQALSLSDAQTFIASDCEVAFYNPGGASVWLYNAGTPRFSIIPADLNRHILEAVFDGSSSSLLLDGVSILSSNPGTAGITGNNALRLNQGASGTNLLQGESMFFLTDLSSGDRLATRSALRAKWGTV